MSRTASPRVTSPPAAATVSCAPGPSPPTTSTPTAAEPCSRHMPAQRRQEAPGLPRRTDTAPHTCFYFTVFFSNNPPIFHSNRIPPERLGSQAAGESHNAAAAAAASASSPCTGCQQEYWRGVFGEPGGDRAGRPGVAFGAASSDDVGSSVQAAAVVGDYRTSMSTMEEVPLQTLQNVAFPTTFGSCGGASAVPVRTLGNRPRPTSTTPLTPQAYTASPTAAAAAPAPSPAHTQPPPPTAARGAVDTRLTLADARAPVRSHFSHDAEKAQATTGAAAAAVAAITNGGPTAQSTRVSSTATFNTLPLTNSSGTTTPVNGAAELTYGTALEPAVPDRFKPTFPAVQWEEEREAGAGGGAGGAAADTPATNGAGVRVAGQVRTRRPRIATTPATSTASAAATTAAEAATRRRTSVAAAPPAVTSAPPPPPAPHRQFSTNSAAAAATVHADPAAQLKAALTAVPEVSPITPSPSASSSAAAAHHLAALAAPKSVVGTVASTAAAAAPAAVAVPHNGPGQEGPPWNMRVEEVRSAKGELRYYRIVLTVAFAALVTTHIGQMHSMQTRNAAAALVLLCPPCGRHYRFLLQHADVLRSALNRTTEFGIRTVQRFFGLLYSPTQKPKGSQQQVLKAIATLLEAHPEALETYCAVKAELASALALRFPLPLLLPTVSAWTVPVLVQSSLSTARARSSASGGGVGGGKARTRRRNSPSTAAAAAVWLDADGSGASSAATSPTAVPAATAAAATVPALADILYEAAAFVREFSEGFASAYICGLLSLTTGGPGTRGLRTRRQHGTSTVSRAADAAAAAAAAAATAATSSMMSVSSPSVSAVEVMPSGAPRGPSPTSTREATSLFTGVLPTESTGGAREAPAWLSPYAAFFHALGGVWDPLHGGSGGEDGVIDFGKPVAVELNGYGSGPYRRSGAGLNSDESDDDDGDGALTAHVSVSTMSSQTPVVSPLTIDVSSSNVAGAAVAGGGGSATRSPTLQFLRSRNSHATLSSNLASPHLSTTTNPSAALSLAPSLGPLLPTPVTEALGNSAAHTVAAARAPHSRHSSANLPSLPSATTAAAGGGRGGLPTTCSADAVTRATASEPAPAPSPPPPPPLPTSSAAAKPVAAEAAREDEYLLHRERLGRVVIFTQDAVLARRLLVLAAFLWSDGATAAATTSSSAAGRVGGLDASEAALRTAEAEHMYETAVAAAVSSVEYSSVPVQWIAEEFCETRMGALCSRFSPENTLLVVVPRQLQCRRVYLRKHVAGTTVLVEEMSGKGARIRSAPFPFRCAVARQVVVQPDPTVTTLLREACTLHQSSRGTVSFADVFQRMVRWLYWQTAATVMARGTHAQTATRAASQASAQGGGGGGATLSRFTSADAVWPSSGLSAEGASLSGDNVGSRLTTPLAVSPAVQLSRGGPSANPSNASASFPVCRRDGAVWGAAGLGWTGGGARGEAESVEEALLPGSMGYASGAWAYTASGGGATTAGATASAAPSLTAHPRGASVPVTSSLLTAHGLVQPPAVFTFPSPTTASPTKSASSFKFLNWFRSSPTTASGAAAGRSHPILSPTTLGQMYSADGGVGGQLPRLLAGDDEDSFFE